MKKISENGIIIMEGGSNERDNVAWMNKYNKPKITPILKKFNSQYNIMTIGTIPSVTFIKNL